MSEMAISDIDELNERFVRAWNRGNMRAACDVYDENAFYVSAGGIILTHGDILRRFQNAYSGRNAMGTLSNHLVSSRCEGNMGVGLWQWSIEKPDGSKVAGYNLETYEKDDDGCVSIEYDLTVTKTD